MASGNEVTMTFRGDAGNLEKTFDRVGSSAKRMETNTRTAGAGIDRVGEAADNVDTKAMGFRDTLTGVQDTMAGTAMIARGDLFTGLLTLGMGVGDLGSGIYNFLVPSLKSFANWSKVSAGAQAAFNAVMNANPVFLVVTAIAALTAGLVLAYNKSETFRDIVDGAFRAIGRAAEWLWDSAVGPALSWIGDKLVWLWEKTEWLRDGIGQAFGWIGDKIGLTSDGASDAVDGVGSAMEETSERTTGLVAQVEALTAGFETLIEPVLGARDAQRAFQEAIDKASDAATENGRTLDISTEAGRNNEQALDDLAQATWDMVEAAIENGATHVNAANKMRTGRQEFIKTAQQMGMNRSEARRLADQLGLIPKRVNTTVKAHTSDASRRISALHDQIGRVPSVKTITFYQRVEGARFAGRYGAAAGDVIGRDVQRLATGGPAGMGTQLVGEFGPELVRLPAGSQVIPNERSRRMINDANSGGGGRIVIDVTGADEDLLRLFRRIVKVRGGDVQRVVGAA